MARCGFVKGRSNNSPFTRRCISVTSSGRSSISRPSAHNPGGCKQCSEQCSAADSFTGFRRCHNQTTLTTTDRDARSSTRAVKSSVEPLPRSIADESLRAAGLSSQRGFCCGLFRFVEVNFVNFQQRKIAFTSFGGRILPEMVSPVRRLKRRFG